MRNNTWGSRCYLIISFFIMYFPIFFLIAYSFNSGDSMTRFEGFSLDHYYQMFSDIRLITILLNTILLALLSSLIATIIGTLGAIFIYYTKQRVEQSVLLNLNSVLMVSPDVIIGASFLLLFTFLGIKLGFFSVLLSHIAFNIPIVVLMVLPRLEEMNYTMMMAARDLGANTWQIFSQVLLPTISPGIFAGFFMAFTYSLDDFAVTFFVTGNGFTTLAVEIYSRARTGVKLEINALSAVIFFIAMILVFGYYLLCQKEGETKRKKVKS